MPNPVYVDFIVRGIPNVQRAFKTVQDAALAAERSQTGKAKSESQQRINLANKEAKDKITAMKKADKWRDQALNKAERDAKRSADKQIREENRKAGAAGKAAEKAERERVRAAEMAEKRIQGIRDRSASMAGRYYAKLAKEEANARFVRERDEMRNRRRLASHLGGAAVGGMQAGARRVGRFAMQTANMVGQLGGGFSIADSVQRNAKNAGETADLLNAGINPFSQNKANHTRRNRADLEGSLDTTTMGFGMERSDAIAGLRAFTGKTGDLDAGIKLLPKLAELSRATGTSLEHMAGAAGAAGLAFDDVTDGGEKAKKILTVLRTAAGQGKAGTVEISDMAVQMSKLVATANKFDGDNVENLAKMGMLAQFAAGGGGAWSASSAATSVTSFGSVFSKSARINAFKEKGINVFADKGQTKIKAPEEIIADAFEKTNGNQEQVSKLFGSAMGMRAVNKFGTAFSGGYTGGDGKKLTGREAVLAMAKDLTKTQMSDKDVSEASSARMQELDAKMAQTREQFDAAVREKIIPTLLALVPEFEKLAKQLPDIVGKALPAFIDLIKTVAQFAEANRWLIDNIAAHPIGAIMAAEVGKSIATAGLAELFKVGISKAMGDAGLGAAFGKLGGSLGSLAAAAGIAAAAWLAIQAGKAAIDKTYEEEDGMRSDGRNAQIEAARLTARVKNGSATPEEKQQAAKLVTQLQGQKGALESSISDPSITKAIGGWSAGLTAEGKEAQAAEQAQQARQLGDLTKSLRDLQSALDKNTNATKADSAGGSGPNGAARGTSIVQRNGVK